MHNQWALDSRNADYFTRNLTLKSICFAINRGQARGNGEEMHKGAVDLRFLCVSAHSVDIQYRFIGAKGHSVRTKANYPGKGFIILMILEITRLAPYGHVVQEENVDKKRHSRPLYKAEPDNSERKQKKLWKGMSIPIFQQCIPENWS